MANIVFTTIDFTGSSVANRDITLTPFVSPRVYGNQISTGDTITKTTDTSGTVSSSLVNNLYTVNIANTPAFVISVPTGSGTYLASQLVISQSAVSQTSSVNVIFDLLYADTSDFPTASIEMYPSDSTNVPLLVSGSIVVGDWQEVTANATGDYTFSNVQPGLYDIEINGKPTDFNILVPTGNGETYSASALIVTTSVTAIQTLPVGYANYLFYSKEQVDYMVAHLTASNAIRVEELTADDIYMADGAVHISAKSDLVSIETADGLYKIGNSNGNLGFHGNLFGTASYALSTANDSLTSVSASWASKSLVSTSGSWVSRSAVAYGVANNTPLSFDSTVIANNGAGGINVHDYGSDENAFYTQYENMFITNPTILSGVIKFLDDTNSITANANNFTIQTEAGGTYYIGNVGGNRGFHGDLFGTASVAIKSLSATSASFASRSLVATSGSWASASLTSVSASWASKSLVSTSGSWVSRSAVAYGVWPDTSLIFGNTVISNNGSGMTAHDNNTDSDVFSTSDDVMYIPNLHVADTLYFIDNNNWIQSDQFSFAFHSAGDSNTYYIGKVGGLSGFHGNLIGTASAATTASQAITASNANVASDIQFGAGLKYIHLVENFIGKESVTSDNRLGCSNDWYVTCQTRLMYPTASNAHPGGFRMGTNNVANTSWAYLTLNAGNNSPMYNAPASDSAVASQVRHLFAFRVPDTSSCMFAIGLIHGSPSAATDNYPPGMVCRYTPRDSANPATQNKFVFSIKNGYGTTTETTASSTIGLDQNWHLLSVRSSGSYYLFKLDAENEISLSVAQCPPLFGVSAFVATSESVAKYMDVSYMELLVPRTSSIWGSN